MLDAFDAGLCVDVTGIDEAPALLDRLLTANLFVVPLDDQARWYRYHHLFGAFLRARLASLGSARLRSAHERACRALEDRRDVEGALTHAMAIGDVERAGRILRSALARSMSMAEGADVAVRAARLWLDEFGASFVETDPSSVVELLIGLVTLTGADDAPSWLDRVSQAHPEPEGELAALVEAAWSEHPPPTGPAAGGHPPPAAGDRRRRCRSAEPPAADPGRGVDGVGPRPGG